VDHVGRSAKREPGSDARSSRAGGVACREALTAALAGTHPRRIRGPTDLIAQMHLLEEEAVAWARRSGGAIPELHLCADARWTTTPDAQV
jgi:hypothetical protein